METITKSKQKTHINDLLKSLVSDFGMERKKARAELVRMGRGVLDYLTEYADHPKHIFRWEALKVMEEIADPTSIPFFIDALEDEESDIRWIAAEGLINIGRESIVPLLETIIKKTDSIFVLEGTHHVFHDLKKTEILPKDFPVDKLLSTLKRTDSDEAIKLSAYQILDILNNIN